MRHPRIDNSFSEFLQKAFNNVIMLINAEENLSFEVKKALVGCTEKCEDLAGRFTESSEFIQRTIEDMRSNL